MHEIVMGLKIQPEFGLHPEKHPQPRGGIGRNRALARDDLANAALRYSNFLSQTVLRHPQRFEKLFEQDFTRGRRWNFALCHGTCSSMVIGDLDVPRRSITPCETDAKLVVDADAPLSNPIAGEFLQSVLWRHAQSFDARGSI